MENEEIIFRKYLEVKDKIKQKILKKHITGKLPGYRVLAKDYGFSYLTIRQAVTELVKEGFLYRIPRKGTFVANPKVRYNRNFNIGFYLYDKLKDGISSPYYSLIFKNIQKEIHKNGYNLLFFTHIEDIDSSKVDGVLATFFPEVENKIIELSKFISVVLLDNDIKGQDIPSVTVDNFNSTYQAIEYAYSLGHRKIAYLSGLLNSSIGLKRLTGYKTALQNVGIEFIEEYIYQGNYEFLSGYESAQHFLGLSDRPTFIHCSNDLMAFGLIKALNERGINVPEDISVSGFDNVEQGERNHPALTTMGVNYEQLAKESVEILIHMIQDEPIEDPKRIIPARLIERASCRKI